jgi:hypothetical protein
MYHQFGFLGVSPAVLVGTELHFGCQNGWVFSHDWYQKPQIKMTCQKDGLFDEPENWPICIDPIPPTEPGKRE